MEALAKTIYDYWFVQFDFPDKNGRPYKSSGGKMAWSEQLKREVPDGWSACGIGDCGAFNRGASYSKADEVAKGDADPYLDCAFTLRNGIKTSPTKPNT